MHTSSSEARTVVFGRETMRGKLFMSLNLSTVIKIIFTTESRGRRVLWF